MQKKTCIIVPCYNEAKRLRGDDFVRYARKNRHIYFLFVNDGSEDETRQILQKIGSREKRNIRVLHLDPNAGKAEAVRRGVLASYQWKHFEYVGYLDADLSCPLAEIGAAMGMIEKEKTCRMVLGSRIKRLGAEIERNPLRHYIGRILATITSILLKLPVYDTQCGLKLLSTEWARRAFSSQFETTWLFDCEILARLIRGYGYAGVQSSTVEMPLHTWIEKENSRIKMSYLFKIPVELYRIHRMIRRTGG